MIKSLHKTQRRTHMSHLDSTLELIGIKDKNVSLDENFFATEVKSIAGKPVKHKVIKATLQAPTNPPCPKCKEKTIKWGKSLSKIRIPQAFGHPALLQLAKTRYHCKNCAYTHTLETSIVEKNCFISKATKKRVLIHSMDILSEKSIARYNDVSASTVARILHPLLFQRKTRRNSLPEHIMVDEFKVVKANDTAAMSFLFANAKTHEVLDLLPDRRLAQLRSYFLQYPRQAREKVKTVSMDIYTPYMSLVKEVFPKAEIILDRFHVMQLLYRALLKTRVDRMNTFRTDSKEYKLLKKYWRHLQKKPMNLNTSLRFYCYHRRCFTTSFETVEDLLEIDKELTATYARIHSLGQAYMDKNKERFFSLLDEDAQEISEYALTAIHTLRKYKDYLENSMSYAYNNGPIEGLIRKAKALTTVSYGYRNFERFKNRYLIICRQMIPISEDTFSYKKAS